MSECTCQCHDRTDLYRLLAFPRSAQLQDEINRLLALNVGWRLYGELQFYNGGYRREMLRTPDNRPWLLPHHTPPVSH